MLVGALSVELATAGAVVEVRYVPSKLNLADAPSRGVFQELRKLNAKEVEPVFPHWNLRSDMWLPWRQ